jgi:hypothetical protein
MRGFFLCALLFAVSLDAFSQMGSSPKATSLYFKEPSIDLGDIKEGDVVSHYFEFESISNDTVVISVNSTTTGLIPICERNIFSPGEKGKVGFSFHTQGRPGEANKCFNVEVKDRPHQWYSLCFKANVIPEKK